MGPAETSVSQTLVREWITNKQLFKCKSFFLAARYLLQGKGRLGRAAGYS